MDPTRVSFPKAPTGIQGLDEITGGGLPSGRPTLICGDAGCGKTLLAMEFLVRGATQFDEPGVFMAFEETGDFNLEGLFVRLGYAIDAIGARRVVLDTVESLFAGLPNPLILRAELRRLFRWLKDKGVTAIITGERGEGQLTRQGLEEYVSDCVIVLDHRVSNLVSTRRLRVVKYRGSTHGTNEYPFVIDADGIAVLPITSLALAAYRQHRAGRDRHPPPRHHAERRGLLPRQQRPGLGDGGDGQDHAGRPFCRRRLPPG